MKVCFLVGTLGRGGAEKQLVYMLRALRQAGIAVRVLCLTRGESYESEIENSGVKVEWIGEAKNQVVRLWNIVANLRREPADIVQSSHFYTNIYAGITGKFLKIPGIGAIRSDLIYELKSHRFTGNWQISLPQFLIANSALARARTIERGVLPEKIECVRNVVETEQKSEFVETENQPLNILFVGRLDRNKRPERFVKLASVLTKRLPNLPIQFQIAGDGELRSEVENLAVELNLSPAKLKFLGVCHRMSEIYRKADVLISTSEREGSPNAVLEAMAYGLPVIASNVGGTSEILDEKSGILVAPNDENELVNAVTELISNKDLRQQLGFAGQKYVAQNHSLGYLQKHLTAIYEKLVSSN
jgi:L-malate glycosyltransferase